MRTRLIIGGVIALALIGGAVFFQYSQGQIGWFDPKSGRDIPSDWREHFNEEFGFSLLYPEGMRVREERNAERTRTILFEDVENALTFQLFFGPYNDPVITEERLRKDIPSGIVRSPETISIDGGEATAFLSHDMVLGEMAEVWFIRDGFIYEFTAPAPLAPWLRDVATTWRRI